ncbi:MAG: TIGR01212 family radical SAM protein [Cyanobacteria bacterium DS2.3.42]|nr:TIGR01212 family radical SAM protein [Cyanobacteria bacterium DS2.3.42]
MQKGARLHRHRTPVVNWPNVVESLHRALGYEARVSRLAAVLLLMHTIDGQQKNKAERQNISKNTGKNASAVTDKGTSTGQTQPRYTSFNGYLKEKFSARVYRVPIDAGFTCPNRDGTRAMGGCTFCDDRGSGAPTINQVLSVKEQLFTGIERIRRRFKAEKFLAYFQAFTNTYAPEAVLRSLYDVSLDHEDVVGICIGTRPDCLDDNVLNLLAEYQEKTFVFLEVGLQSAHNKTLDLINRAHSAEEFFDAVERAKKKNIEVATHLIFGLPGESREDMMETVRQVADIGLTAIKIHQLCVYKHTPMAVDYEQGRLPLLEEDEYVQLVCDALEMLPPDMVVMRLVAEGTREEIIAPDWCFEKNRIMDKIDQELIRRGTRQGSRFSPKN